MGFKSIAGYDSWKTAQDDRWLCEIHDHWTSQDVCSYCYEEYEEKMARKKTAKQLRDARERLRLAKIYRRDLKGLVTFEHPRLLLRAAFATDEHRRSEIEWLNRVESFQRVSGFYPAWAAIETQ